MAAKWWRYNSTSHIFEQSLDEGTSWTIPPLNASIITEGIFAKAVLPAAVAYEDEANVFTKSQKITGLYPEVTLEWTGAIQKGRFQLANNVGVLFIGSNLGYLPSGWALDDTTQPGFMFFQTTTGMSLYKANPGANPVTVSPIFGVNSTGQITERGRSFFIGEWVSVPYQAGNFLGGDGGGALSIAGIHVNRYMMIGKTIFWTIWLENAALGTPISYYFRLVVPGGFTFAYNGGAAVGFFDNAGVPKHASCYWYGGNNIVFVLCHTPATLVAGAMNLRLSIVAEVQ